jgi:hypothetical protein
VLRRVKQVIRKLLRRVEGAPPRLPPARHALWSIGIFTGTSPLALTPDAAIANPVVTRESVTDVPASFVADPFLVRAGERWHLFFEVLNRRSGRGEIGLATSDDLARWQYQRIVLAEPFHLSYPLVFEWQGAHYMLPESHQAASIRLYRADPFPGEWKHVHTLLDGHPFSDATLFRHDDRWWLFAQNSPSGRHDNLRLYFADDLFGVWTEHPASPIIEDDPHVARPAGRVVRTGDALFRFAQDCKPRYGLSVMAFEITTLTITAYAERPASAAPILGGSSTGWNAARMHHVDAHEVEPGRWIASVDGAFDTTRASIDGTT